LDPGSGDQPKMAGRSGPSQIRSWSRLPPNEGLLHNRARKNRLRSNPSHKILNILNNVSMKLCSECSEFETLGSSSFQILNILNNVFLSRYSEGPEFRVTRTVIATQIPNSEHSEHALEGNKARIFRIALLSLAVCGVMFAFCGCGGSAAITTRNKAFLVASPVELGVTKESLCTWDVGIVTPCLFGAS